ncbi:MAG TPA: glycerol-3-phosphate acyltransferase, partial [Gemmatimonadaceae bacterium]
MNPIVGLIISYLAGSIPSAYIAGRLRGIDLRKHGSGNLGATNVVRVLGVKTGAVVFSADLLKGYLPVRFLPMYTETLRPE